MVGHPGQPGQHVLEIGVGIEVPAAAGFNDGVNDGAAFSGISLAHKEPVLLADGRGPDGVFDQVVVDL